MAVLACGTERAMVADSAGTVAYLEQQSARFSAASRPAVMALTANEAVVTETPDLPPVTPPDVTSNMVIRTATASVEVDSLEPAIAAVKDLARQLGGYVANSGIQAGRNRLRQAALEVKIPAARFDDVLSGLHPIGRVETVDVSAQDVGEEFVDVTARMENSRRLERRLIDLLATRTGKLKDVLEVEQSLARVREEIERYEGRMRYLRAHAAMSTVSITVHEPLPVVGTAGKSVMGEAFTQAWRNFVVLTAFAVQSFGVVLPLGVLAIAGWMLTKRLRLARQRAA
jgi:hypothetical protein